MNVNELNDVADWISAWVDGPLLKKYEELDKILKMNAAGQSPQPFAEIKKELESHIRSADIHQLSQAQLEVLSTLSILSLLGKKGVTELEEILFRNSLDLKTAASRVSENLLKLSQARDWANKRSTLLEPLVESEELESANQEAIIHIGFRGEAEIHDFEDLKKWSATWHEIAYSVARAKGQPVQELRITGASRGSIILDIATNLDIGAVLVALLYGSLKVIREIHEIRLLRAKAENLLLKNDILLEQFKKSEEEKKIKAIDDMTASISLELGVDDTEKEEAEGWLKSSIRKFFSFVDEGGEVDIVVPETHEPDAGDETQSEKRLKLRQQLEELRKLDWEVKRLEYDGNREEENEDADTEETE